MEDYEKELKRREVIDARRDAVDEIIAKEHIYNDEGELVDSPLIKKDGNLVPNPYGANREMADPRQDIAWDYYVESLTIGRPNAVLAAEKAGYSRSFAQVITNTKWWKEKKARLRRKNMLSKAERNLSRILNIDYSNIIQLEDGSEKETIDRELVKVVADISKYVTQTIGKDSGYSTKTQEDKNLSHNIKIESVSYADAVEAPEVREVITEAVVEEIKDESTE